MLLLLLTSCGWHQEPHVPVGADAESDRVIQVMGMLIQNGRITTTIFREDLKTEVKPDGSIWARLTDEHADAIRTPMEAVHVWIGEIDSRDPLFKRAQEIRAEMQACKEADAAALKIKLNMEFERNPGLKQAVMREMFRNQLETHRTSATKGKP